MRLPGEKSAAVVLSHEDLAAINALATLLSTISGNTPAPGDLTASGNITTQNLVSGGVATANSAVEISCDARPTVSVQVSGTYTGALSAQATIDGTNWVTLSGLLNSNTGALASTIASAAVGLFQVETAGFQKVRITALAAVTGTATVSLRACVRAGLIGLDASLPTGANVIGAVTQSGTWTVQPGNTANTTRWLVDNQPITPTTTFTNSAATTNATSTKSSAGTLWSVSVSNINAAARFLKLYNKASAPALGTDVPVLVVPIPAGSNVTLAFGANGVRFSTGIAWALTGSAADSDTTAVSANEHKVALSYT